MKSQQLWFPYETEILANEAASSLLVTSQESVLWYFKVKSFTSVCKPGEDEVKATARNI